MRVDSRALAATAGAFLLLLVAGCDGAGSGRPPRADGAAPLANGQRIYTAHCAACHGAQLQGQPNWRERDPKTGRLPAPPHDAGGHTWHHPDEVLFNITKYGVARAAQLKDYDSAMPAYEGVLTDDEIIAVLAWIRSRWPEDIRRQQAEVDAAARKRR